ncbi:hypothetical protein, partial [Pseudomonas izuensis]|uniref:hypothetical protein n=1 Tax=Pseudomonas izuensis TaxID=2684212 RepID=UPI001C499FD3
EPPLGLARGQEDQKPKRGGLTADLIAVGTQSPVGAGLPAKAVGQSTNLLSDTDETNMYTVPLLIEQHFGVEPCFSARAVLL